MSDDELAEMIVAHLASLEDLKRELVGFDLELDRIAGEIVEWVTQHVSQGASA